MLRLCVIASLLIAFVTKTQADITPWTEMKVQNGHISIPVKVSAIDTHAVLDTGNNGGVLFDRSLADAMGWSNSLSAIQSITVDATSHISVMDNYRIPELQFGPYTLENVLVSVPNDSKLNLLERHREFGSRIRGKRVQGILGYDVLQHFVVTVDYKNGHAHIGVPDDAD